MKTKSGVNCPFTDLSFNGGTSLMHSHLASEHSEHSSSCANQQMLDLFCRSSGFSVARSKEISERIAFFVAQDL